MLNLYVCLEFKMRLSGSPVPHAGRVELRFSGVWGTISSYKWKNVDPEIPRVICRQLNFTDIILATSWPVFGSGTGPQWFSISHLQCSENEKNLLKCSSREPYLGRSSCFSDLSVVCKQDVHQTSGKLSNQSIEEEHRHV